MILSRGENITVVDSSGSTSQVITSTGGGAFAALSCASLTSTGTISAPAFSSTGAITCASLSSTGTITGNAITSTGAVSSYNVPLNYSENGTTTANLKAYGVSFLDTSTSADTRKFYTLDAPVKGIAKELVLASTVGVTASSNVTIVNTGSSNVQIFSYNSTAINVDLTNFAMQTPYTYVKLIGVSATKWAMADFKSASTNVTYNGVFGTTANGTAGLSSGMSTGIVST